MSPQPPKYVVEIADLHRFAIKVRSDEPLLELCSLAFEQIDGAYADICNHNPDQWPQVDDIEPYECQIEVVRFHQPIDFDQLDQWVHEVDRRRHATLRELAALYSTHQLALQDLGYVLAFGQFFSLPESHLPVVIGHNQSTYLRLMRIMPRWPNKVSFVLATDPDPASSPPLSS